MAGGFPGPPLVLLCLFLSVVLARCLGPLVSKPLSCQHGPVHAAIALILSRSAIHVKTSRLSVLSHPICPFFTPFFFETLFCYLCWVSFLFLPAMLDFFDPPTAFPFKEARHNTHSNVPFLLQGCLDVFSDLSQHESATLSLSAVRKGESQAQSNLGCCSWPECQCPSRVEHLTVKCLEI